MSWLLVFKSVRALHETNVRLLAELSFKDRELKRAEALVRDADTRDRLNYAQIDDLKGQLYERDTKVQQLGYQLELALARPSGPPLDLLKDFQDRVLQEVPYPDGRIPDTAWLTPGDDDVRTDAPAA